MLYTEYLSVDHSVVHVSKWASQYGRSIVDLGWAPTFRCFKAAAEPWLSQRYEYLVPRWVPKYLVPWIRILLTNGFSEALCEVTLGGSIYGVLCSTGRSRSPSKGKCRPGLLKTTPTLFVIVGSWRQVETRVSHSLVSRLRRLDGGPLVRVDSGAAHEKNGEYEGQSEGKGCHWEGDGY